MSTEYLPSQIGRLNSQLEEKFFQLNDILDIVLQYSNHFNKYNPQKLLPFDFDKPSSPKSSQGLKTPPRVSEGQPNSSQDSNNTPKITEFSLGKPNQFLESPDVKVMRLLESMRYSEKEPAKTPERDPNAYYGKVMVGDEYEDRIKSTDKKRFYYPDPSTAHSNNPVENELSSQKKEDNIIHVQRDISGFNTDDISKLESAKIIQKAYREYRQKNKRGNLKDFLRGVSLDHLLAFCALIKETYKKIQAQNKYFNSCAAKIQRKYKKFALQQSQKKLGMLCSKRSSQCDSNSVTEFSVEDLARAPFESQGSKANSDYVQLNQMEPIIEDQLESRFSDVENLLDTHKPKSGEVDPESHFSFRKDTSRSYSSGEPFEGLLQAKNLPEGTQEVDCQFHSLREYETFQETRDPSASNSNFATPMKNSKLCEDYQESGKSKVKEYAPDTYEHVTELYEDGTFYEGQKMNGLRHGKGSYDFNNTFKYFGDWVNDEMHGFGAMTVNDELLYEGTFANSEFSGQGTLFNLQGVEKVEFNLEKGQMPEWIRYEGKFNGGLREGFGIQFFNNGDHFMGNFKNGKIEGQGTYTKHKEYSIVGKWERDELKSVIIKRNLNKNSSE